MMVYYIITTDYFLQELDKKIDELSSLERSLDEKISSYGTGR